MKAQMGTQRHHRLMAMRKSLVAEMERLAMKDKTSMPTKAAGLVCRQEMKRQAITRGLEMLDVRRAHHP